MPIIMYLYSTNNSHITHIHLYNFFILTIYYKSDITVNPNIITQIEINLNLNKKLISMFNVLLP